MVNKKSTVLIAAVISGLFAFVINMFFAQLFENFFALKFLPSVGSVLFIALDSFLITGTIFLALALILGVDNRELSRFSNQIFFSIAAGVVFTIFSVVINAGAAFLIATFFVRFGLTFFAVMIADNITGGN